MMTIIPISELIEVFKLAQKLTDLYLFDDEEYFKIGESAPRVMGVITQWLAKYFPN